MAQAGRTVKHYHANNGRFSDNGFIDAVHGKYQKITFCGVGEDNTKLSVYDSNLQLLYQPSFSNMPNTPLDYRNEVGTGLTLDEAQDLAIPRTLSPLQQEFMSWNH